MSDLLARDLETRVEVLDALVAVLELFLDVVRPPLLQLPVLVVLRPRVVKPASRFEIYQTCRFVQS